MNLITQVWCAIRRRCTVIFPGDDFTDYLREQRDASTAAVQDLIERQRIIDDAFFPPRGEKRDQRHAE